MFRKFQVFATLWVTTSFFAQDTVAQLSDEPTLYHCCTFCPSDNNGISTGARVLDDDRDGLQARRNTCSARLVGATRVDANGCPSQFDPYHGMMFQPGAHEAWYRRFWTGKCDGLGLLDFCSESEGSWPAQIEKLLARAAPADHAAMRAELWALGRMIGYEWAKDNNARAIHSNQHLARWYAILSEGHAWTAINQVCEEAVEAIEIHYE